METNTAPAKRRGRPRLHNDIDQAQRERISAADAKAATLPPVQVMLVTIKQAAEILNISTRTVELLISEGQLSSIKIRDSRRIALDELKRMAAHGTSYTTSQE